MHSNICYLAVGFIAVKAELVFKRTVLLEHASKCILQLLLILRFGLQIVTLKQRGFSSFPRSHAYKPAISITQTITQSVILADTNAFLLRRKETYPIIHLCNIW